jgi:hypothetical protein
MRVSREFERGGKAMEAVREKVREKRRKKKREKPRERERQGSALPNQKPPLMVAVMSGASESLEWPWWLFGFQ